MKKTELPIYQPGDEVVLALVLDKENKMERVLVGTESDVHLRLEGNEVANVWYDRVRPMGTLLLEHDIQDRAWWCEKVFAPYRNALQYPREQKQNEQRGWENLEDKLASDNAVSVLCAHRTLSLYYPGKYGKRNAVWTEMFGRRMLTLARHFGTKLLDDEYLYLDKILEHVSETFEKRLYRDETDLKIWYPWRECQQECVVAEESLLPLILYYLHRMDDWGLCFRICEVCGKIFVASSGHYCLCSDACEREQNRRNKRAYDMRNKGNKVEKIYQQIRDRIRKMLNQLAERKDVSPDFLVAAEAQYKVFRDEAKLRKGKNGIKVEKEDYIDWLYEQEKYFEELVGGYK